jgi:trk system potassium uptake protein
VQGLRAVFDRDVHIIVVGCGRVGSSLGVELARSGHSVTVIDKSEGAFRRLPEGWGGRQLIGMGFDRNTLEKAGAGEADALAAVTSGDNSNILCARIARETYEIPAVVARIYDPRRAEIYQRLGIPTVATVTWTIEQVQRKLFPNLTVSEWVDPTGQLQLVERALPLSWAGKPVRMLAEEPGVRLVGVTRGGTVNLGGGELVGQEGDILHLAVLASARESLEKVLDIGDETGGRARR